MGAGKRIVETLSILFYHTDAKEPLEQHDYHYFYARDAGRAQSIADDYLRGLAHRVLKSTLMACPDGWSLHPRLPGTRLLRPDEARE